MLLILYYLTQKCIVKVMRRRQRTKSYKKPHIIMRVISYGFIIILVTFCSVYFINTERKKLNQEIQNSSTQERLQQNSLLELREKVYQQELSELNQNSKKILNATENYSDLNTFLKQIDHKNLKCNLSKIQNNPESIDVVINKKHCITPINFTPKNLVTHENVIIAKIAEKDYLKMMQAQKDAGLNLAVSSSYRSLEEQILTYNYWIQVTGSAQKADEVSARPAYSEHQTGLAIDLKVDDCALDCFSTTPEYSWLQNNAHKYGFVLRYPKDHTHTTGYNEESWHYRYVGVEVATSMKQNNIKTLEKFWNIEGGDY